MLTSRRGFLSAFATCLAPATALGHVEAGAEAAAQAGVGQVGGFAVHELRFTHTARAMQQARVYVPHELTPDQTWPVAILLHGYAQALADERALAAWRAEYNVLDAYRSLVQGEVIETPALGRERAREINQDLQTAPFHGMVLINPVTPIPYFQRDLGQTLERYTDWIHQELLPAVAQVAPISTAPEALGLAGVSMGGLVGLELMWRFPERFGAFCGVQIAIKRSQVQRYAWLLQRAFGHLKAGQGRPIRVVTAKRDTYRWSNQAFYDALRHNHVDATFELREGAHTSRWMRQAGSLESLVWLDRTLHAREVSTSTATGGFEEPALAAEPGGG